MPHVLMDYFIEMDEDDGKKRKAWQPIWIYYVVGWVCHWLWQCMEVSMDVRTKWWWWIHDHLPLMFACTWTSNYDYGVICRSCGSKEPGKNVSDPAT